MDIIIDASNDKITFIFVGTSHWRPTAKHLEMINDCIQRDLLNIYQIKQLIGVDYVQEYPAISNNKKYVYIISGYYSEADLKDWKDCFNCFNRVKGDSNFIITTGHNVKVKRIRKDLLAFL